MTLKRTDPKRDSRLTATDDQFQKLLLDSDDRTAVIVGSTLLDYRLAEYIRALAVPDKKLLDDLLDGRKPSALFGSFAAKIRVLQLFGKIGADEANDLTIIREIRNDFAHNVIGCSFSDPDVIRHTEKLLLAWKALKNPATPPRIVFNLETHLLYSWLGARIESSKHAQPPEDRNIA